MLKLLVWESHPDRSKENSQKKRIHFLLNTLLNGTVFLLVEDGALHYFFLSQRFY